MLEEFDHYLYFLILMILRSIMSLLLVSGHIIQHVLVLVYYILQLINIDLVLVMYLFCIFVFELVVVIIQYYYLFYFVWFILVNNIIYFDLFLLLNGVAKTWSRSTSFLLLTKYI